MPYFFMLPAYLLFLFGLLTAGLGLRFTRFKALARYVFGAALGSIPSFIGANALLMPLLRGLAGISATTANGQAARGVLAAVVIFLGPIIMSALGIGLGAAFGLCATWYNRQLH